MTTEINSIQPQLVYLSPTTRNIAFIIRQNLYVFSLYLNPDQDDRIFDCLLTSMAAVQTEDVRASFLFASDLNDHHQEWLGSTTTNRHLL